MPPQIRCNDGMSQRLQVMGAFRFIHRGRQIRFRMTITQEDGYGGAFVHGAVVPNENRDPAIRIDRELFRWARLFHVNR